jgi:hypothetical protein
MKKVALYSRSVPHRSGRLGALTVRARQGTSPTPDTPAAAPPPPRRSRLAATIAR